jgi:hypothetical protein
MQHNVQNTQLANLIIDGLKESTEDKNTRREYETQVIEMLHDLVKSNQAILNHLRILTEYNDDLIEEETL